MSARAVAPAVSAAAKTVTRTPSGAFSRELSGIVVSSGLAPKTVKVQVAKEVWNKKVKKNFQHFERYLVHDPRDSLRTGDIVSISSGWRTSKTKRHIVNRIIAPWGPPIDQRPAVPTPEEREAAHAAERAKKNARKQLRAQAEAMERAVEKAHRTTEELARRGGDLGYRAP
ncbi:hypothetical protein KVR01_007164 [Diaporthe batatas]|uniref:mitochondrial 37S ribosomal protein MRPS17 n=1 Tax=Diaporthe batatas TaxID=748121 RepID=UPI001D045216|nr:mitochondrial 37S ribosomal protein MRPS17 [Diaporthe batatas]KAG8162686.1 hypothetical protein KVR01_007164 [Diaporthe batatas]